MLASKNIRHIFFSLFLLPAVGQSLFAMDTLPLFRDTISLAGRWTCRLDPSDEGVDANWQDSSFHENMMFPGSLEENKKGKFLEKGTTDHLSQTWYYVGPAWYQKQVSIPAGWENKSLSLVLERTKATQVWIDHQLVGGSKLLSAPQVFDLTGKLPAGEHTLTIRVDNSPSNFPVGGSHALSEHTQTNWNGILGNMRILAMNPTHIQAVSISPDIEHKTAVVKVHIANGQKAPGNYQLQLQALEWNTPAGKQNLSAVTVPVQLREKDTTVSVLYQLGASAQLWSEYNPALYRLSVRLLRQTDLVDGYSTSFGLREFTAVGTQFRINNDIVFLRGKHDGGVFPLTGYPPTSVEAWRKVFRKAKEYGINHYRFHSYTPPEAAFRAADIEGIYIQAELPNWSAYSAEDTGHTSYQYREGRAILDAFGNHPSFVMFSLGNELSGDSSITNKMVFDFKKSDPRHLYAQGSNAFFDKPSPGRFDDYWVTMWTRKPSPNGAFDVRGSFATTEHAGNGIINTQPPTTRRDYAVAIRGHELPVIGHEVGQYQVYPDYSEIPRYTGVLRPLNFEVFRKRLQEAGMGDQARDFFRASGKLTALLYREEIEMALRTPGFGGFQLLDLEDYPGQGTALVGMLNAFMQDKGLIDAAEFRSFNSDVVIQLLMDKYTWTNREIFSGDVQIVNYSPASLTNKTLEWKVADKKTHRMIASGTIAVPLVKKGRINPVGKISFSLAGIARASELTVQLRIANSSLHIQYPVWIYPGSTEVSIPGDITVTTKLDDAVAAKLQNGARVLLFPDAEAIKDHSVGPQFISEFWNWRMFKQIAENMKRPVSAGTLGILTDPHHALFNKFPTDFYTNWQWWFILKHARPLVLDATPDTYRPIVQVIDNVDRNHKLGIIFEFRVGRGKLLVCTSDLRALGDRPEAKQLYRSIISYMASGQFAPKQTISIEQLKKLL